jgi:hypothetical protein
MGKVFALRSQKASEMTCFRGLQSFSFAEANATLLACLGRKQA